MRTNNWAAFGQTGFKRGAINSVEKQGFRGTVPAGGDMERWRHADEETCGQGGTGTRRHVHIWSTQFGPNPPTLATEHVVSLLNELRGIFSVCHKLKISKLSTRKISGTSEKINLTAHFSAFSPRYWSSSSETFSARTTLRTVKSWANTHGICWGCSATSYFLEGFLKKVKPAQTDNANL